MIPELGHFALILALFVAFVQGVLPLVGAARGNQALMTIAPRAALLQFVLIAASFAALMWCYVASDFSVLNVAQNSLTDKPMLYKIAGVWGNHEGSMLLWVLILSFYGMTVALFGRNLPLTLRARALAIQALIAVGFILFILFTSNPFWRVDPAPLNGQGLNPLLQDPGLAFHPPFLYLGYVGFSMAFSFAIAALLEGRVDPAWARWVRPWTLLAWCFLTFGIGMGSWWAYYTLGWGGWWYWDPVENASFMPWLAGTALLHSSIVVERRDNLKAWTILLTIITFSFSLLGTFLVRSGVLTSVHSFASDPSRGVFILALLILTIGGSTVLFAIRAPRLSGGGLFSPVSRESALLFNNVMMSTAAGTILLGTLYPLFMDVLNLSQVSVGPPYFNAVFVPLMVATIAVMVFGPLLSWRHGNFAGAFKAAAPVMGVAVFVFVLVALVSKSWAAGASLALAAWLLAGTAEAFIQRIGVQDAVRHTLLKRVLAIPLSFYGMILAHAGIAVVIVGITGSTFWKTEKIQVMHAGEAVQVAAYTLTLKSVEEDVKGPNYIATRATFDVTKHGRPVATLYPERRLFQTPPRPTTFAAIHTNLLGDIYAVIGDPDDTGGYVTRLYFNPLVPWIFIGAGIIASGGLVSLADRRYRIKFRS